MNERIQELFHESIEDCDGTMKDRVYSLKQSEIEKFAELIVRECIGCCEQVISDPVPENVDTWLNGGEQCIDEIRQHFGVE